MGIVTNRTMNPGGDFYYICAPQTQKSGNRSKVGYERERKEGEHSDLGVGGPQKVGTEKRQLNARLLISPSQCESSRLVKDPGVEHVSFSGAE